MAKATWGTANEERQASRQLPPAAGGAESAAARVRLISSAPPTARRVEIRVAASASAKSEGIGEQRLPAGEAERRREHETQ